MFLRVLIRLKINWLVESVGCVGIDILLIETLVIRDVCAMDVMICL